MKGVAISMDFFLVQEGIPLVSDKPRDCQMCFSSDQKLSLVDMGDGTFDWLCEGCKEEWKKVKRDV